jgi:hypothetical protein
MREEEKRGGLGLLALKGYGPRWVGPGQAGLHRWGREGRRGDELGRKRPRLGVGFSFFCFIFLLF